MTTRTKYLFYRNGTTTKMPDIRIIFTATLIGWLAVSYQIKATVSTTAARNLDRSNDTVVFHHL